MSPGPTYDTNMYSAFFMEGLRDVDSYEAVLDKWDQGALELASHLVLYAPMADALCKVGDEFTKGVEHAGVFDYEVCSTFGNWFGTRILESRPPAPNECCSELVELVAAFFRIEQHSKANQDRFRAMLEVTAEGLIP